MFRTSLESSWKTIHNISLPETEQIFWRQQGSVKNASSKFQA
jgi:hypothetical protein